MNPSTSSATTSTPTPANESLPETITELRRYTWSITTVVWKALCAALLPIRLDQLPRLLPAIVEHLVRHDAHRNRESALERTLRIWKTDIEEAPG